MLIVSEHVKVLYDGTLYNLIADTYFQLFHFCGKDNQNCQRPHQIETILYDAHHLIRTVTGIETKHIAN